MLGQNQPIPYEREREREREKKKNKACQVPNKTNPRAGSKTKFLKARPMEKMSLWGS